MAHDLSAAHEAGHDHHADDDGGHDYHASFGGYAKGFLLSVLLTAIPFWLVMSKALPTPAMTAAVILGFAAVQVVVHMVYFLHLNAKVEQGWTMLALVFTAILVVILLAGSTWVMAHMNANMMPTHEMRDMQ